jgi:hypothetical protein
VRQAVNITAVVPVTPSNLGVFQAACVAVMDARDVAVRRGIAYALLLEAIGVRALRRREPGGAA